MQECNIEEKYNFMHIDQHSDLGVRGPANNVAFLKSDSQISLDNYCMITYSNCDGIYKSFQCDNYITACRFLFPNWFNTNLFYYTEPYIKGSTFGGGYENFTPQRMEIGHLLQDITLFIEEQVFPSNTAGSGTSVLANMRFRKKDVKTFKTLTTLFCKPCGNKIFPEKVFSWISGDGSHDHFCQEIRTTRNTTLSILSCHINSLSLK